MDRSHKSKSEPKEVTEPNNGNLQSTSSPASENLGAEINTSTAGVSSQTSERPEGAPANESGSGTTPDKVIKVLKSSTIEDPEAKSEGTASVGGQGGHQQQIQLKVATTPDNTGTTSNTISPRKGQQGLGRRYGTNVGSSESGNHQYEQPGPSDQNDSDGKPITSANMEHQENTGGCHISLSSSNYLTEMEAVPEESSNVGTAEMVDGDETTVEDLLGAHEESSTLLYAQPIQPEHCNCYQPEVEAQMVPNTMNNVHRSFPSALSIPDIAIFVTVTDRFQGQIPDVRINAISYRTLPVMSSQVSDCSVRPDDAMMTKTFD